VSKKILTSSFFLIAGDVDDFRLELDEFLKQIFNEYECILHGFNINFVDKKNTKITFYQCYFSFPMKEIVLLIFVAEKI